jgi:hypothetical protein
MMSNHSICKERCKQISRRNCTPAPTRAQQPHTASEHRLHILPSLGPYLALPPHSRITSSNNHPHSVNSTIKEASLRSQAQPIHPLTTPSITTNAIHNTTSHTPNHPLRTPIQPIDLQAIPPRVQPIHKHAQLPPTSHRSAPAGPPPLRIPSIGPTRPCRSPTTAAQL